MKKLLQSLKSLILKYYEVVLKFVFIIVIIIAAWYGFLYLVGDPPIDATQALLMVWISVIVFLFVLFPKIFDRIKRLKLKDFEIELSETVKKYSEKDFISMDEVNDYIFSQKEDFRNLVNIAKQARRNPEKQILLTVNLRGGDYISIPMLFIYLFFLEMASNNLNVLFFSSRKSIRNFSDISQNSIIGVISGKKVIKTLYRRFAWLYKIFEFEGFSKIEMDDFLTRGIFIEQPGESLFHRCFYFLRENQRNEREFLRKRDVIAWYKKELNNKIMDLDDIESNKQAVKDAIEKGDEFLIVSENKAFRSVIAVCKVTRNISLKVFKNIKK